MTKSRSTGPGLRGRVPAQWAAAAVGAVFLLVGVLGFVPGVTTDYDQLAWMGPESGARLLGVFEVSILHNLLHALFGLLGFAASATSRAARAFLLLGGVAYLVLFVHGMVVNHAADANFLPVNDADNWLHFALGAGMVALGAVLPGRARRPPR